MAIQLKNRVERGGVALPLGALLAGGASSHVLDKILATLDEEAVHRPWRNRTSPQSNNRKPLRKPAEPLLAVVEQMSGELDAVLRSCPRPAEDCSRNSLLPLRGRGPSEGLFSSERHPLTPTPLPEAGRGAFRTALRLQPEKRRLMDRRNSR
jgi:hypothetical protein